MTIAASSVSVLLSSHVLAELDRVADFLVVLTRGQVRVADAIEDLLARHRVLTGPAAGADRLGGQLDVVQDRRAGAQAHLLVRGSGPGEPVPPGWESHPVSMEELVLAYLRGEAGGTLFDSGRAARSLPWRRMVLVTWLQHRGALLGVAGLLGAVALYLGIMGLIIHHAWDSSLACHPASSAACQAKANAFGDQWHSGATIAFPMQLLPALIGAFVGVPVLAREMETGTFRYAWTQGFGRTRA